MNSHIFLYAFGDIHDEYIISAQQCLGYEPEQRKCRNKSIKRIFTMALAAALVLACAMATAMAVSPELRATIISMFRLDEAEQVPDISAKVNEVRQITIGETVSANYVKVDGIWSWGTDGALLCNGTWAGDGSSFYKLDGEELTEIGADAPVVSAQTSWNGRDYTAMFRWFVYDGILYTDEIATRKLFDGMADAVLIPSRLGERTDVVLLTATVLEPTMENYTWVYDLESGEVTDVLEDCGVEVLGPIRVVTIADDLKHAIVQAGETSEGTPYLADLEEQTLTPLSEVFGMEIKEWQFQTGEGGYRAGFCNSDTILLTTGERNTTWTYHIPSGALVCTVADGTGLRPIDSRRGMLNLSVDEAGGVSVVDLATGGRVKLEGINGNGEFICKANSTDTKLLWAEWSGSDEHRSISIERLGVIDLETGEFTAFDRVHQEELRDEWVYWLGDSRVMIVNDLHSSENSDPGHSPAYYLCVYEF